MKKTVIFLTAILSLLLFAACKKDTSTTTGTITEIRENSVTILTDDFKKANGEKSRGDLNFSWDKAEDFKVGDRLKISLKGPVATSFPAQVTVTKVEKIEN